MSRGLTTMGVTRMGGSLYVLGGYFGQPHNYSKDFQSGDFERLDVATGKWEQLPPIQGLQSVALVNDGRYLYRIGGMRALNADGETEDMQSIKEVARFDPVARSWAALPDLPTPRSSHQAVIVDHTLYVVGGWALHGGYDATWADTLASCDLSQPRCNWKSALVPFQTRAMGAAAYHGKLYVTGGLTPNNLSSAVWVADLATGKWSAGPALADGDITPAAAVFGDRLFANGSNGVLYRLSPDGQHWDSTGELQFPRMFHQLVGADDGLWVVGGMPGKDRGARVRHVEHVLAPPPAGVVWTVESASRAKNRQGVFLRGQQLYVFGGNTSLGQHDFEAENFADGAFRLDLGSLAWTEVDTFPARRQSMQTLIAGEEDHHVGYAVGGFGLAGDHLAAQAEVFSYDFQSGSWAKLKHGLPAPRSQFGLAEWGGAAWLLGGLDYDDQREEAERFRHPTAILRMDLAAPARGFVDAGFQLREPRRAFAGAQLGSEYYLTGGIREDFKAVTSCEAIDLERHESRDVACPNAQRLGGELVALGGKLYLVGGSVETAGGSREATPSIEVYDPANNRWSTLTDNFPFPSSEHVRAFAFHDDLLLYTAQRESGGAELALLDLAALAHGATAYTRLDVPATAPVAGAKPAPMTAAKRSALAKP